MLSTMVVILLVLWALGLDISYLIRGLIHALLVIAVIVISVNVIQGLTLLKTTNASVFKN
jgi:hypothetical protein